MKHPADRPHASPFSVLAASRCAVVAVALAAADADAATAPGPFSSVGGTCGLAAYGVPGPADQRSLIAVTTPTGNGLEFEGSCGTFDGFNFAPDLSQYFFGGSYAFAKGMSAPGVLRMYGEVGAEGSPAAYGTGFVMGENPYRARAQLAMTVGFADVVVPPAGTGAPDVGDPTTITAAYRLDCVESELNSLVNTVAIVALYTPTAYANDEAPYATSFRSTRVSPTMHAICELTNAGFDDEFAATVGTPVVVAVSIATTLDSSVLPIIFPFSSLAKYVLWTNALNTATLEIASADGAPLTGQSGKTYGPPGPLPTVTTSSTVTTTSSLPPTTTTLVGCVGTCGDGTVEAACGETCDCPPTADPIRAAYGCDGATIVPSQEACVVCRGCRIVDARCEVVLPTTTTSISTSSSTSVTSSTVTTSTLPPLDDVRCYPSRTAKGTPKFSARTVRLADDFEDKSVIVEAIASICPPAGLDGDAIDDPTAHLACYKTKDAKGQPAFAGRDVLTTDRFGGLALRLGRASTLCLPAGADGGPVAAGLDHFKCYPAKLRKGTPAFVARTVTVTDRFETKSVVVGKPLAVCTAADKNDEGVPRPGDRLVCYAAKDARKQLAFEKRTAVVADQFGALTLEVKKSNRLCVPASVVAP